MASVARARCSRAVDRGHARVEELGDLGRLPAQHVAEDQDGTLAGGEVLERGDEGETDGVVGCGDLGRVAVVGKHALVGDR